MHIKDIRPSSRFTFGQRGFIRRQRSLGMFQALRFLALERKHPQNPLILIRYVSSLRRTASPAAIVYTLDRSVHVRIPRRSAFGSYRFGNGSGLRAHRDHLVAVVAKKFWRSALVSIRARCHKFSRNFAMNLRILIRWTDRIHAFQGHRRRNETRIGVASISSFDSVASRSFLELLGEVSRYRATYPLL